LNREVITVRRAIYFLATFAVMIAVGAAAWLFNGKWPWPSGETQEQSASVEKADPAKSIPRADRPVAANRLASNGAPGIQSGMTRSAKGLEASPSVSITAAAMRIEVARIDPEGVSVIAGRAPAGSRVTLLANGVPVSSMMASADGQWSAIVSKGLGPGKLELSIKSDWGPVAGTTSPIVAIDVPAGTGQMELAAASPPRPVLTSPPLAGRSRSPAVDEFAALVDRERARAAETDAARVASVSTTAAVAAATSTDASASTSPISPSSTSSRRAPVPVPITFLTGEATMTPEGAQGANLLVEYLRITNPGTITLSGHADERGSDEYNLELSRERLETIERHLRANGFKGRLSLLAKGKSEPYSGIDRRAAELEEVRQADRRVELRLID
jgi:outer membrane protein OmpA-like peptidoglycan-associated protein